MRESSQSNSFQCSSNNQINLWWRLWICWPIEHGTTTHTLNGGKLPPRGPLSNLLSFPTAPALAESSWSVSVWFRSQQLVTLSLGSLPRACSQVQANHWPSRSKENLTHYAWFQSFAITSFCFSDNVHSLFAFPLISKLLMAEKSSCCPPLAWAGQIDLKCVSTGQDSEHSGPVRGIPAMERHTCHGEAWLEKCFIHFCYNSSCSPRISCSTTYQKGDSLVTQMVKNLPTVWGTWVQSLENSLEKEMATHSNILGWKSPWTEESGGLQSMGLQRVKHDWANNTFTFSYRKTYTGQAASPFIIYPLGRSPVGHKDSWIREDIYIGWALSLGAGSGIPPGGSLHDLCASPIMVPCGREWCGNPWGVGYRLGIFPCALWSALECTLRLCLESPARPKLGENLQGASAELWGHVTPGGEGTIRGRLGCLISLLQI